VQDVAVGVLEPCGLEVAEDVFVGQGDAARVVLAPRRRDDEAGNFGRIVANDVPTAVLSGRPVVDTTENVAPTKSRAEPCATNAIAVAAQEEAAAVFGADPRVYLTTAKKFVGDEHGYVKEAHTVEIQWEKNEKGQFVPKEIPGTEKVRPVQLVLLAMGFLGPEQPLLEQLGVERDPRSNAKAEYNQYATSVKGVFAAGDCRRGQSLVVWAFNEGRGAARECDRYLMGSTDLP